MTAAGRIFALPRTDGDVEEILAGLARVGFRAEVRRPRPGAYEQEDTSLREHLTGARTGLLLGLVLGALLGLLLVLLVPGLRSRDTIVQLVFVAGVAIQGTIPAIMWRMGRAETSDDDPVVLHEVGPGHRLIVVEAPHGAGHARHLLESHGVTFLADDQPTGGPDRLPTP